MPLILPRANPLAYPAGFASGFDPSHVASSSIRLSAVTYGVAYISVGPNRISNAIIGAPAFQLNPNIGGAGSYSTGNRIQLSTLPAVVDTSQTIAAFIFPTAFTNDTAGIVSTTVGGQGGCLQVSNTGVLKFIWIGAGGNATSTITLTANTPYFVAVSISAANNAVFIATNLLTGSTVNTVTTVSAGAAATPSGTYLVGMRPGTNTAFTGLIGPIMVNAKFMPLAQLLQWAADPWSFWYPRRQIERVGITASGFMPYWANRNNDFAIGTGLQ